MIIFDKARDKISIIAPASPPHAKEATKTLEDACKLLTDKGFKVTYHPKIFSKTSLDFFASPKHIRSEALRHALEDKDVKIIWALRGGYGTTEIMSDFMLTNPAKEILQNKLLIGYSDITALHMLFNQHYRIPSLHAPVLNSLLGGQKSMLEEVLAFFEKIHAEYHLIPLSQESLKDNPSKEVVSIPDHQADKIEADIIGGNLAVFCNLIGTELHPKTEGKILIFEDINENGYKIHRYLIHLYNAGLLKDIKAIILGDFIGTDRDILIEESIMDFYLRYLSPSNIPCYRLQGFGHGKENHPITLGSRAILDRKELTLQVSSPLKIAS